MTYLLFILGEIGCFYTRVSSLTFRDAGFSDIALLTLF